MSASDPISPQRYRRRILGLGGLALVVTFAIGAAIFIPVVQNDLEERVETELTNDGIEGVRASFSGQDGTLSCDQPLADPASVEALAEAVHGVRVVDLDTSCSSAAQPAAEAATTDVPDTDPPATAPIVTEPSASTSTTGVPTTTEPDVDDIGDIVEGDPLFGQLAELWADAGLDEDDALGGEGPFTLLAPTDAAFDAAFDELGADAFNELKSDPEALRTVLLHHATDGAIASSDFVAGDLDMLDGSTITVDPESNDGITFTSNGATSGVDDPTTQLDIEASNGVVHAIDRLLIPEGLGLGEPPADATTTVAVLAGGQITLSGSVQNEDQREALLATARAQVDPENVVDELVIDADAVLAQADLARFTVVVDAMPPNLVGGEARLVGDTLSLTGTYFDEAAQAALSEIGADRDVALELSPRDVADADSAAALQAELNDFVSGDPILFEPNSATLTASATAVLDQVAARALRLEGTSIVIIGHTDSDGNAATNQALSQSRADTVLAELVARGLDEAALSSDGRGSTEPINDESGAEDKAASRRVEFAVEAT